MSLATGTKLGSYEILAAIGAGGMGEVYRARDAKLGRDVALKVLPEAFARDAERMARLQREAKVLASLNHANIAAIYGFEDSGGAHALVMELVEGSTLADRIKSGPIPIDEALRIAKQICEGLEYAHERGIVHRDLKPANVKVSRDDAVKILDFGLAKAVAGEAIETDISTSPTLTHMATQAGFILGTAAYMSPEQAKGKPVDRRADIWAFGCVLYEMLTARMAFSGETVTDTLAAIVMKDPDWSQLPGVTPARVRVLLQRCLQKDSKQRLRDIGDARISLDEAISGAPLESRTPSELGLTRTGRRQTILWSIACLAVAVTVGLAAWYLKPVTEGLPLSANARVMRLSINPPEGGSFFFGDNLGGVSVSPDGKTAAFVATANGETALWVRPLDSADARMIRGTRGAFYPFWSPDSKSIGFFATNRLESVDLSGGIPFTICNINDGRGGAWTGDGHIIFGAVSTGLFRVSASGGTPSPLTTVDSAHGEQDYRWPQVLPDGKLLFWVRSVQPEVTGIYAASLTRPSERVHLVTTDTGALYAPGNDDRDYLIWQREGQLGAQEFDPRTLKMIGEFRTISDQVGMNETIGQMVAGVSGNGLLLYSGANTIGQLTWFDRSGKRLGIVGDPGQDEVFSLSPDGRRIAVSRDKTGGTDLWLLEAERGVASRFTARPGNSIWPVWSPDGRTIIFRQGLNLFRKDVAGTVDEERLTESPNLQDPTDWSRDGRSLLFFEAAPNTGFDLWVLPVTPDGKPQGKPRVYLRTQFNEQYGRFSPEANPRLVAYQSDESGQTEVYIDAFPEPQNKLRISTNGGRYPEWNPNGRELFYVSADLKLMVVNVNKNGNSIATSTPRELFTLSVFENGLDQYGVATDGQSFLVFALPERHASEPLTLVSNWPALFKESTAAK
jgi:serine/threonine protein kinase/dipeptidyl aminopeptidase/acylaminoacyl peptidase